MDYEYTKNLSSVQEEYLVLIESEDISLAKKSTLSKRTNSIIIDINTTSVAVV